LPFTQLKELTNVSLEGVECSIKYFFEGVGAGEAPLIIFRAKIGDKTPCIASGAILLVSDY